MLQCKHEKGKVTMLEQKVAGNVRISLAPFYKNNGWTVIVEEFRNNEWWGTYCEWYADYDIARSDYTAALTYYGM